MSESHTEFYERWSAEARPYFAWQYEQLRPFLGKRVADVGCGVGSFVEHVLGGGAELYLGCEPDPELRKVFRSRHEDSRALLADNPDATTRAFAEELRARRVDSVMSVNVIEHIEDDVLAIRRICEGLPPGGTIALLVPAHPFLYGTLDRLDNHYRRYTKRTLLEAVEKGSGGRARVERISHFNFLAAFGWFLKGRVLKEAKHENENFRVMNAVLPVVSRLERVVPPPFGLSLVLGARLS